MEWRGGENPRESAPAIGDGARRLGPFVLTVFYGIVFAGIVDLSWLTAGGTSGPWFTASTSSQVYTATLTTATIATLILASLAASKLAGTETRARAAAAHEAANSMSPGPIEVDVPRTVIVTPPEPMPPEGPDQALSEPHRLRSCRRSFDHIPSIASESGRDLDPNGFGRSSGAANRRSILSPRFERSVWSPWRGDRRFGLKQNAPERFLSGVSS